MDARQRRTRARLFAAAIALAEEGPIAEVTMTRVARVAEVHRSTVYEHAGSPAELLRAALTAPLDGVRSRFDDVSAADIDERVREVTIEVFELVARHADIYARELDADGANLRSMLGSHFAATSRELMARGAIRVPFTVDGIDADELAASWFADAFVGVIAVWLRSGRRDTRALLVAVEQLYPDWWPGGTA
ncbi:TetR family transcriptional regulator [Galbitalea sp. SE-J8]|uniref:TetR/AcrR family transcriptional regulator n=1 Tax=Galbitalea sp. SE-J8 TaxID=3054952 RepID=UPI00259CEF0F|nr:TetR family transcriptional regulator [Galbitalea sp. SE-J8]MDM4762780.1 TetR family transcriptional regulator [Galbitalea sp. SE-J8]